MKKVISVLLAVVLLMGQVVSVHAEVFNYKGQLKTKEKKMYKILNQHFCEKSSTKTCVIDIGSKSTILTNDELQKKCNDRIYLAYSAMIREHPELYWARTIENSCLGYNDYIDDVLVSTRVESVEVTLSGTTPHKKSDIKAFQKAVKKAVRQIQNTLSPTAGRAAKIRAINRWICNNTAYDWNHAADTSGKYEYLHNAYGVFIRKRAACDGYSAAFKILCGYFDIPCFYVSGYAYNNYGHLGDHAWNLVRVKKHWYIVDSTWNDTNGSTKWLMCGTSTIRSTHVTSRKKLDVIEKGRFKLPKISKTAYAG